MYVYVCMYTYTFTYVYICVYIYIYGFNPTVTAWDDPPSEILRCSSQPQTAQQKEIDPINPMLSVRYLILGAFGWPLHKMELGRK